jgi:hypothetical protein
MDNVIIDAIIDAIEDAGAQGASIEQVFEYIGYASLGLVSEDNQGVIGTTLDNMLKSNIIIFRRNRFFYCKND